MKIVRKICQRVSLFKDGKIHETLDVTNGELNPNTDYGKALMREF